MSAYLKFFAQIAVTVVSALAAALSQGPLTVAEWVNVLILALGAVSVLGAGNLPAGVWRYTKTIVSAASAGAVLLHSLIAGGGVITPTEWMQVALAVMGSLGVFAVNGPPVLTPVASRTVTGQMFNAPMAITDADALAFQHAVMADAKLSGEPAESPAVVVQSSQVAPPMGEHA